MIRTMQRYLHRLYGTVCKKHYRVLPEYKKNNYFRETKAYKTNLQKINQLLYTSNKTGTAS